MEMVQWREHRGDAGKEASTAGRWPVGEGTGCRDAVCRARRGLRWRLREDG